MKNLSRKFNFKNEQGHELSGRLELPYTKVRGTAIFAHCFTCSKNAAAATKVSRRLASLGVATLRFDFTGLGNSEGDFGNSSFHANVEDIKSAYQALKKEFKAPEILIGHSLGGAACLEACKSLEEIKAVVTIGAPSDSEHVTHLFEDGDNEKGGAKVKLGGQSFELSDVFVKSLKETKILDGLDSGKKAFLIMHSPVDKIVSIDHAAKIFQSLKHPKSFMSLREADHLLSNDDDAEYAAEIIYSFVQPYLDDSLHQGERLEEGEVLIKSIDEKKFLQNIWTKDHHHLADEPKDMGGDNLGFNPYDYLLSALGACTSMTIKMYARRKKMNLEGVEVKLSHQRVHAEDCDGCEESDKKVSKITKEIDLKGDLSEEEIKKLLDISSKCPVHKTLLGEIMIETKKIIS